jgi:hypothetical protein
MMAGPGIGGTGLKLSKTGSNNLEEMTFSSLSVDRGFHESSRKVNMEPRDSYHC